MKIAVVGLGFMGATHLNAWQKVNGAEVVAVVSGDEKKLAGDLRAIRGNLGETTARIDFSGVARYRTLDECLCDPNVEAVDICAPTDLHERLTTMALRAGKHVLVEKPMALTFASATRMIRESQDADRVLMCAQVLRFMTPYRAAREALPTMGRVHSAWFHRSCGFPNWSPWLADPARSGGPVFDLLIHDIDYAFQLFGAPEWISAQNDKAHFSYPNHGPVTIEGGWYQPPSYPWNAEFKIITDRGTLHHAGDAGDGFAEELIYFHLCAEQRRAGNLVAGLSLCPPTDSAQAVHLATLIIESINRNGERIPCSISE